MVAGPIRLSVSSVGSWALQPCSRMNAQQATSDFQYPRSDRGHCNADRRLRSRTAGPFQYPRSDRGHCNVTRSRNHPRISASLSVSSVGSWALQPLQAAKATPAVLRLSVSSVGSWALQLAVQAQLYHDRQRGFQYPRSDRGHCNAWRRSIGALAIGAFSILGRIVGTATLRPRQDSARMPAAFSILGRIVGTATIVASSPHPCQSVDFQYPRSDRGHCNASRELCPSASDPLSVSSVGSWALQPP